MTVTAYSVAPHTFRLENGIEIDVRREGRDGTAIELYASSDGPSLGYRCFDRVLSDDVRSDVLAFAAPAVGAEVAEALAACVEKGGTRVRDVLHVVKLPRKEFIDVRGRAVKAHRFDRAGVELASGRAVERTLWAADCIDGDDEDGEHTVYALVCGEWREVEYYTAGLWQVR